MATGVFRPPPAMQGLPGGLSQPAQTAAQPPAANTAGYAAGASAAAGNAAASQHQYATNPNNPGSSAYYQVGGHWSPGMPKPPEGSVGYQDWVNYGKGRDNAGAAAGAASAAAAARIPNPRDVANATAGMDFMKPGAAESFWSQYGAGIMQPGATEQWYGAHGGDLSQPGMSQTFARDALGRGPELAPVNTDAYYDRAVELASRKINAELGARGAYGSSVGLGQVGSAVADIRAQQAKDSADYGLRRSDLQRGWTSTLADVAGSADRSELDRWSAELTGAAAADRSGLDRWKAGSGAAVDAQSAQRARGQDFFSNNVTLGTALSGTAGAAYTGAGAQDQALLDAIIALGIGQGAEGVAAAMQRAQGDRELQNQILQAAAIYKQSQPTTTKTTTSGPNGSETRTTTTGIS